MAVVDVIVAVTFAREKNVLPSVRGGGYSVTDKAIRDDSLVIDLSGVCDVRVDQDNKTVNVQGGATLGDIDDETALFNLTIFLGQVSRTGIAGPYLQCDIGWLTHKYGLSLYNLLSSPIRQYGSCKNETITIVNDAPDHD